MSILTDQGFLITYMESEITCPICTAVFDASKKMDRAKLPVFNIKCPKCKGKITISMPIFGGQLECWETECPPTIERLKTITPDKINDTVIEGESFNDNSDEPDAIFV